MADVRIGWHKSSRSGPGNCVEVAVEVDGVHVRDTKDRERGHQTYTRSEWQAFIEGVKLGEFDLPD